MKITQKGMIYDWCVMIGLYVKNKLFYIIWNAISYILDSLYQSADQELN